MPITSAGVAALGAHVLSRWGPYHVYRLTSRDWPVARPELMRAILFVLSLLTVRSFGLSVLFTRSALALASRECIQSAPRRLRSFPDSAGHLRADPLARQQPSAENAIQRRPAVTRSVSWQSPLRACGGINRIYLHDVPTFPASWCARPFIHDFAVVLEESRRWRAVARHDASAVRALS